jgi:hypothetical protein
MDDQSISRSGAVHGKRSGERIGAQRSGGASRIKTVRIQCGGGDGIARLQGEHGGMRSKGVVLSERGKEVSSHFFLNSPNSVLILSEIG